MNNALREQIIQATMYSIMGHSDNLRKLIITVKDNAPLLAELIQLTDTTRQQVYSNTFGGQQ